jgi:hypothetical protein
MPSYAIGGAREGTDVPEKVVVLSDSQVHWLQIA